MISIAITLKNRSHFLDIKLNQLLHMDFNLKEIEICISDGNSNDNLIEILEKYYKHFYQIKYCISDRAKLPFKISSNQPTCDMNSQICNQVSFEKVIRTDPEVLFYCKQQLKYIDEKLNKNILLSHDTIPMSKNFIYKNDFIFEESNIYQDSNTCLCFNRTDFINMGGFDERFALGFAFEDSHFIHLFREEKRYEVSPYRVIHLYHENPINIEENKKLKREYSFPLYKNLISSNQKSNINNSNWQRPEMLSNEIIFKGN